MTLNIHDLVKTTHQNNRRAYNEIRSKLQFLIQAIYCNNDVVSPTTTFYIKEAEKALNNYEWDDGYIYIDK